MPQCYSNTQMAAALRLAGVGAGDAAFLVATAHPESSGCNVIQQGQPYSTTGWGVWQITPGNSEPQIAVNNGLLSLIPNAEAAAAKLRSQGLSAWTTITSGLYLPYFSSAKSAVAQVYGMSRNEVNKLAHSAGKSGGGSGGGNPSTTALGFNPLGDVFGHVLNDLASQFGAGSVKDLFIRGGLIVFGGLLVVIGILTMVGRQNLGTAAMVAVPETRLASLASTGQQQQATSRRNAGTAQARAQTASRQADTAAARERRLAERET